MRVRRQISYDDIAEIGVSLIKTQTDFLWECNDEKERLVSTYIICGIVDFLDSLDKATRMTQEEINKAMKEFKNSHITCLSMDSEVLNKYNDKNNCSRE